MQKRAYVRAVPRMPMTVAFEEAGEPLAYGAVANISEGGACVWTAANFDVGQSIRLLLSAARQPQPIEAPAMVVWEAGQKDKDSHTHRYGLRWLAPTKEYRSELQRLLST